MKLVTAAQMRAIDKRAIEGLGIPGLQLMENAGRGVADYILGIFDSNVKGKKVAIFCGSGNNGGDGYVVARYLHEWGADVRVFLLANRDSIKGDAGVNLKKIGQSEIKIDTGTPPFRVGSQFDLIVDAIFGTGFRGEVDAKTKTVIDAINESNVPVVAIDTPSGLNNDTGEISNAIVRADHTISLALPKIGQFLYPGRLYCGKVKVIDIGIPEETVSSFGCNLYLIDDALVRGLIPERKVTSHKGDCGKLFLLAGSVGMTGAAVLAAESAVKSGCGLVTVGIPESLNDIIEVKLTEAMSKPLPELKRRRVFPVRAFGLIMENIQRNDAVCLGPGVGRHHETIELFRRLIAKIEKPAVLDADGLFPFSGKPELLRECKADLVITPHIGEFARLTSREVAEIEADRFAFVESFAKEINKTVLLKGAPTLIASPDGEIYLSPTGNPGMASGGSGDVLTGIIGALLALGMPSLQAAICGAYIHGYAGDLARDDIGTFGMTAGDICDYLPKMFKLLKD